MSEEVKLMTMNNRGETKARKAIPLRPDYAVQLGGVLPALIFQQLEYLTGIYGNQHGFCKFILPPSDINNEFYKKGESWQEEVGVTHHQFNRAFKEIGVSYAGMQEFKQKLNNDADVFEGKLYAKVRDGVSNLTWFFRNHNAADHFLDEMNSREEEQPKRSVLPRFPLAQEFKVKLFGFKNEGQEGQEDKQEKQEKQEKRYSNQSKQKPTEKKGGYFDERTGAFIPNAADRELLEEYIEHYGLERIIDAVKSARLQVGGKVYLSIIAKILNPPNKQKQRGMNLSEGKWDVQNKTGFSDGIFPDFTF
jgi:hypothetical protein